MSNSIHQPEDSEYPLQQQIAAALTSHNVPSLRGVEVRVDKSAVVLRGQVTSFYAKQLLQHSVRRVAGDNLVIDEVRVVTPAAFRDTLGLHRTATAGVALLVAVLAAGCSKTQPLLEVHPVSGQVMFNGRPAAGAHVVFHPKSADPNSRWASAKTDSQGHNSLSTYSPGDGAPVGEYAVTVELRPTVRDPSGELQLGENVLPPQYSSAKTTRVAASVRAGRNTVPIKIVR